MEGLSTQQQRILSEYQSITHSEDIPDSIRILNENDWDLETSVQNRYIPSGYKRQRYERDEAEYDDDNDSPSSTSALLGHTYSSASSSATASRRPKRRLLSAFMWPFNVVARISWYLYHYTARLLYRPAITPPRRRDPRSEADRFLHNFESTYGTLHPNFFSEGGYIQALKSAKDGLKYMMAILCSEEHDANDAFCRQVLTDRELLDFLHQHQVIVWGGNVRYTEAYQVSDILQATAYPFIAIIALQPPTSSSSGSSTNSLNSQRKMVVMDRIEGLTNASTVIRRFQTVMQLVDASLQLLREEQEQREMERRLRQQQDQAYLDSLRADQDKQRQKEEAERAQKRRESRARLREQYINYLLQTIPDEPTTTTAATASPSAKPTVTRINFRMADGERVLRRFKADDTLEDLYKFVEVYPYLQRAQKKKMSSSSRTAYQLGEASSSSNESNSKQTADLQPPEGYIHQFNFSLHTPFPRNEYAPDSSKILIEEKGLWPSATLIVDTIEDEESEEEDSL